MRRYVIWVITFAGGLFFLLEFLLPARLPLGPSGTPNPLTPWLGGVMNFLVVVGTMAFLLGPLNLLRTNLATLFRRRKGWIESLTFLGFFVLSFAVMALKTEDGLAGVKAFFNAVYCHAVLAVSVLVPPLKALAVPDVTATVYNGMFYGILTAFGSSSMALLAFYLVSAAHRALRMSTLEAGLMLAAGTIILLGQTPVGDWLTSGLPRAMTLDAWTQWILSVPNAGVQRGVVIGACGGAFAAGMRQWLSLGKQAE